jgi:hypothetical protein
MSDSGSSSLGLARLSAFSQATREFIIIVALSFLAADLAISAVGHRLTPRVGSSEGLHVKVGTVVPLPAIRSLSGEVFDLKAQKKPSLYVFFSTGCRFCARSTPYWRALDQEAQLWDLPLYLIGLEREPEEVGRFAKAHALDDLMIWYDAFGECGQHLQIRSVPQYLFIDGAGKILEAWAGALAPKSDVNAKAQETIARLRLLLP